MLHGLAHGVVQLDARQQVHIHLWLVKTEITTAALLDPEHSCVGTLDQDVQCSTICRVHGHANAATQRKIDRVQHERLPQFFQYAPGHYLGTQGISLLQKRDELVAPDAAQSVDLAQGLLDTCRGFYQHAVTKSVPQGIVYVLEAIQVNEHQRKRCTIALRRAQGNCHALAQQQAVRQPSQYIGISKGFYAFLRVQALGQITKRIDPAHDPAAAGLRQCHPLQHAPGAQ